MGKLYDAIMEKFGEDAVAIIDIRFYVDPSRASCVDEKNVENVLVDCIQRSREISLDELLGDCPG